jgi:hypothetical protein
MIPVIPRPAPADDSLDTAFAYIRDLISKRYFGVIQLSFQSGQLTHVRQDQSLKPADLSNLVAVSKRGTNGGGR